MNKRSAVAAFERGCARSKEHLYRKELNRAREPDRGGDRRLQATRAGERVYDAAHHGWNVFAVIWNIVTFPLQGGVRASFVFFRLRPFA